MLYPRVRVVADQILFKFYIFLAANSDQQGPYHDDSTASRLLSEVKHRRARLVLRWGTTLESRVFLFLIFLMGRQVGYGLFHYKMELGTVWARNLPG